jgi:predicted dehydrogenase
MNKNLTRRKFIRYTTNTTLGMGLFGSLPKSYANKTAANTLKRIGIIGLDTSHSIAFAKAINGPDPSPAYTGYTITTAYPRGSADIESSVKRIAGYTGRNKKIGIEIAVSIEALLDKCDFVLLETNDGRPHRQQALQVIASGKTLFIDKPVAGSLTDAIAIYEAAKKNKVPVFSSSSLRYMESVQEVLTGKIGKVLGADTFSPATLEKTHPDLFWYGIHGVKF